MAGSNETTQRTLLVAFILCLVCSVMVSTSAVVLRPLQEINKKLDVKKNILMAAGLMDPSKSIDEMFEEIDIKIIDFSTGLMNNEIDPETYDQVKAAGNPKTKVVIPADLDVGGIKVRAKYGKIYFVKGESEYTQIILPVRAIGLWSTMYGFISLDYQDLTTVKGFAFYQHGETPGLGGEVDNPRWKGQWIGKKIFDDSGTIKASLAKGRAPQGSEHQVDGLSGATITGNGVTRMFQYWFGNHAYGKFLSSIKKGYSGPLWDGIYPTMDKFPPMEI
jgi:Na+-transporting NADH:ubiquinone oxidoreductase subunit C